MTRCATVLLIVLAAVAAAGSAHAQGGYARSVAASGDELFVVEPFNVARAGVVYVYGRDATGRWVEQAQLHGPESRAGDRFGRAVAASDGRVLIGNPDAAEGRGGAHVFERRGGQWSQVATLSPAGGAAGDSTGMTLALAGNVAALAAPGAGAVVVFRRDDAGRWTQEARLQVEGTAADDRFGAALAVSGERIAVGAPGRAEGAGGLYLFVREGGSWQPGVLLEPRSSSRNAAVGSSVAFMGDRIVAGAPQRDDGAGAVFVFQMDAELGRWVARHRLQPYDAVPGGFGASVVAHGNDLLIGTPGPQSRAVYRYSYDPESGDWSAHERIRHLLEQAHTQFGVALAAAERFAVVGVPDILNTGTALALERADDGTWTAAAALRSAPEEFPAVTGEPVDCTNGTAASFPCGSVELLAYLPISALGGEQGVHLNDIWGWTDPQTGREYALVGRSNGTAFVDVTDASNPRYLGDLPLTEGARPNLWRDIKVYRDHAFIVADGAGAHGVQIFDLSELRNVQSAPVRFTATAHYDGVASSHNIVINEETGLAVAVGNSSGGTTCGGGLHMIDVRDPRNPKFAGCFADPRTGLGGTGGTHDAQCVTYRGPDARYAGREICFGSNETALSIADVTDRQNPVALARASYPNVQYSHQGWLTDDHRFFYMNDEGDETSGVVPRTRTVIWDVAELDDPVVIGEFLGTSPASDHNLYVRGDTMYQSNYAAGLRIIDISDRRNPREVGFFDSVPNSDNTPGYFGSWSNYPYFRSGNIIFTSIREGLFIVRPSRPIS
jgi:choice-of-anchor B domain-containing protein